MDKIQLFMIILIVGIAGCSTVYTFLKMSKEQKISNIKQWLKFAVVEAEKVLGSGTGQLKLRYVYDLAVKQFPWIVSFVTFEIFSAWVDDALDWMNKQINENKAINSYVKD